jgi:hypothetical protein
MAQAALCLVTRDATPKRRPDPCQLPGEMASAVRRYTVAMDRNEVVRRLRAVPFDTASLRAVRRQISRNAKRVIREVTNKLTTGLKNPH